MFSMSISLLFQTLMDDTCTLIDDDTRTLLDGSVIDDKLTPVTLDQFKLFYGIDRDLYSILVRALCRNPLESLQIMGLWLWLEREGISSVISKILSLDPFSINVLADEAVTCIKLLTDESQTPPEAPAIPLTHSLFRIEISLQYFRVNRNTVYHQIQGLVSEVYIPALSDIMEMARQGGFGESSTMRQVAGRSAPGPSVNRTSAPQTRVPQMRVPPEESLLQEFSRLGIKLEASPPRARGPPDDGTSIARTMFVTFSRGYPVTETEVRNFFTRRFGNCIEMLHMQDVGPYDQALYARIVFVNESLIRTILNGEAKAKFTINGKHVWMRQFVPRHA